MQVIDMLGRTVAHTSREIENGENEIVLPIPEVSKGMYILIVNGSGIHLWKRLLVSR
jgi:hypothetical protein